MTYCSVMFFERNSETGLFDYITSFDTLNSGLALDVYANTSCPASQLIEADTPEKLNAAKIKMIENMNDPEWLAEFLLPYL